MTSRDKNIYKNVTRPMCRIGVKTPIRLLKQRVLIPLMTSYIKQELLKKHQS